MFLLSLRSSSHLTLFSPESLAISIDLSLASFRKVDTWLLRALTWDLMEQGGGLME